MAISVFADAFRLSLSGRTPRRNYWVGMLLYAVITTTIELCSDYLLTITITEQAWIIADNVLMACYAFMYVLLCCLTVRRLHDIGRSGWWILFFFIPLIGWLANLVLGFMASSEGPNRYGPHPYGKGMTNDTVALLERLSQLHQQGALTDEEFMAEKKRLLG